MLELEEESWFCCCCAKDGQLFFDEKGQKLSAFDARQHNKITLRKESIVNRRLRSIFETVHRDFQRYFLQQKIEHFGFDVCFFLNQSESASTAAATGVTGPNNGPLRNKNQLSPFFQLAEYENKI